MSKNIFTILLGCITVYIFSSCSSMYIPSMVNTPLLSEQGEIQGELSLTTNAVQLGVDYAFTDHWAAMAQTNISYGNFTNAYDIYTSKDEDSTLLDLTNWGKFNNRHYELGVGYYNMFNKEHFKMEAFGGFGFCHANDENDYHTNVLEKYDTKYAMIFGQVNTGFSSKFCDFGLALRLAPTFHKFNWETIDDADPTNNAKDESNFAMFHIEPLLFLRAGYDHFKITAKAGCSFPFESKSLQDLSDKVPNSMYTKSTLMHFSIGACFIFNTSPKVK